MAFAGILQPFARLRWIRFGLLMRDAKFSRRFSVPQTTALAPLPFANRTITSVACSAFLAIMVPSEETHEVWQMTKLDLAKLQKAFAGDRDRATCAIVVPRFIG
jgi:hypothetical protein